MEELNYLDIDKSQIPYIFEVELKGKTYEMEINYIPKDDYFTIDLIRNNRVLVEGEKIMYRKPLFSSIKYKDIPEVTIIPYSIYNKEERVTYENFYDTVFLYILGDEDGTI